MPSIPPTHNFLFLVAFTTFAMHAKRKRYRKDK